MSVEACSASLTSKFCLSGDRGIASQCSFTLRDDRFATVPDFLLESLRFPVWFVAESSCRSDLPRLTLLFQHSTQLGRIIMFRFVALFSVLLVALTATSFALNSSTAVVAEHALCTSCDACCCSDCGSCEVCLAGVPCCVGGACSVSGVPCCADKADCCKLTGDCCVGESCRAL